ncbi:MAG: hypothetical protein Q8R18_02175 [bacterium]|nr:hypothetical protein [bacterium]
MSVKHPFEEQRELVLARFKTLNPEAKIMLGGEETEVTVKKLIEHIEKGDDFGKNIIKAQMKMLQILMN